MARLSSPGISAEKVTVLVFDFGNKINRPKFSSVSNIVIRLSLLDVR